jgi:hypothetical protein
MSMLLSNFSGKNIDFLLVGAVSLFEFSTFGLRLLSTLECWLVAVAQFAALILVVVVLVATM